MSDFFNINLGYNVCYPPIAPKIIYIIFKIHSAWGGTGIQVLLLF